MTSAKHELYLVSTVTGLLFEAKYTFRCQNSGDGVLAASTELHVIWQVAISGPSIHDVVASSPHAWGTGVRVLVVLRVFACYVLIYPITGMYKMILKIIMTRFYVFKFLFNDN